jgi:hypothetical protein
MFEDLITPERIPLIEGLYHSPTKSTPVSFGFRNFLSEITTEFCLRRDDLTLEDVEILETNKNRYNREWDYYEVSVNVCVHPETGDFMIRFSILNEGKESDLIFSVSFIIKTTRSVVTDTTTDPVTGIATTKRILNEKKETVIYTEPFDWKNTYLNVRTFFTDVFYKVCDS